MTFLRRVTANGQRPAWALKLDVANFFPSIHKAMLYAILARHLKHPEILWLTRTLLFHDPTTNYHFHSRNRSTALINIVCSALLLNAWMERAFLSLPIPAIRLKKETKYGPDKSSSRSGGRDPDDLLG